ncbi:MAG: ABC transporter ATP-binding protein [Lachnospiraceae bacterium]|nr:ABC transporter ATP-binding protein [Lachnospiraceae bacterium]
MSLLECKGVTRIFDANSAAFKALDDVSMSIEEGEFVAIVGRSGSGKSTLLNVLGMLDVPDEGEVLFEGVNVSTMSDKEKSVLRNKSFGYVFQSFFLEPEYTVYENVEMPLVIAGVKASERDERTRELIELVGLNDRKDQKTKKLSGGEKQRTCIARALACKPSIVLADEPCGNLDSANSAEIMKLFRVIAEQGSAVLMVTHNEDDAAKADRIMYMKDGSLSDERQ